MTFWTPRPKSSLFDYLAGFQFILVIGPQRAGGTIATAMIANDLGHVYDEEGFVWGTIGMGIPKPGKPRDWRPFFAGQQGRWAIHCPEHSAFAHQYHDLTNVAVVMIRRDVKDIIASQKRVGWGFEGLELKHYPGYGRPIATAKYHFWDTHQKKVLGDRAFEIEYESLSTHPMWVPKEQRTDFAISQIEVNKPRGERVQNPELAGQ